MFQVTSDLVKCLNAYSNLQSIKLDGCTVTWSGIKAIASLHAPVKELSLSKCLGLTDDGLSFLVQSHKDLKKLDITCCRKITYTSIDSITNSCTSLTSLRMESCSLVPKEAFVLIGARCSFLEELDATDNEIDDEGFTLTIICFMHEWEFPRVIYALSCRFEVHLEMFKTIYFEVRDML